jgi:GntR family transcriptional regulator
MTKPATLAVDATAGDLAQRLQIDKTLPTPAYLQLRDQLAGVIGEGRWPVGRALPSERDLAIALGLSRMTVRRAFGELEDDELVEPRHGSGTYVRPRRLEQTIDRVVGFTDEALHLGFSPGARLLEFGPVEADADVAAALRCPPGTPVLRVARLRTADGAPLALQHAYLRPSLAALDAAELERDGSLYRTLERRFGVVPQRARQTISARLPHRRERSLLAIGLHEPVLALERTTFDPDDVPFEFVRSAYRGDRYRVALDLRSPEP